MRRIVVINHLSLDGVMQAPGRPDEDVAGGFDRGGWAAAAHDEVMGRYLGAGMSAGGALLLGRRTYEGFASFWPFQKESPFSEVMDRLQKYVPSRTLSEPLPWQNSVLLAGEAKDSVARLKEEPGPDLTVLGSGELIRSLRERRLVDAYVLMIHPLVLGSGRRLFPDGTAPGELRLTESLTTTKGVVIARYEQL